jgi:hypothetical protein
VYLYIHSLLYKNPNVGTNIRITIIVGIARKNISNSDSTRLVKYCGILLVAALWSIIHERVYISWYGYANRIKTHFHPLTNIHR